MQKVLRINAQARNQALKKARKTVFSKRKDKDKEYWNWKNRYESEVNSYVKNEKLARKEDWLAGPLAPDRDTGLQRGVYGSVSGLESMRRARPVVGQPSGPDASGNFKEWSGEGNRGNIVAGDRVCVIRGPDRGKIGAVLTATLADGTVVVEGVNLTDYKVPPAQPSQARAKKVQSREMPIEIDDVRLVRYVENADGTGQDAIIRYLYGGAPYLDRAYGSKTPRHTRYVMGEDIEITWPEPEIEESERTEADTPRRLVEQPTFTPEVLQAPFPDSIARELASQYSTKRKRHESDWVAGKIIEDARSAWYDQRGGRLVTPAAERLKMLTEQRQQEQASGLEEASMRTKMELDQLLAQSTVP